MRETRWVEVPHGTVVSVLNPPVGDPMPYGAGVYVTVKLAPDSPVPGLGCMMTGKVVGNADAPLTLRETTMDSEAIAQICHEANRAYCELIGDDSQLAWDEAPAWQRESAINGVEFHIENPEADPADSHANWYHEKEAAGWIYGPTKDELLKTHPCMLPYDELPEDQRRKDSLFIAVVRALTCDV